MQRLDAAPGSKIESHVDLSGNEQAAERRRRSPDAEHVVFRDRVAESEFPEIRGNPPARDSATVDDAVRTQIEKGLTVSGDKPELDGSRRRQRGQRLIQGTRLDRKSEHEYRGECRCRSWFSGGERAKSRNAMAAMERLRGIRSPELGEGIHGEGRSPKIVGEGRDER